jgi:uncharacterized delta-60 repeat protein
VFSCNELSAKPGDLDSSFGENGQTILNYMGTLIHLTDTEIYKDGSILTLGDILGNTPRLLLAKFSKDGTPDSSFSDDGLNEYIFDEGRSAVHRSIKNSYGEILIYGSITTPKKVFQNMYILKVSENGTITNVHGTNDNGLPVSDSNCYNIPVGIYRFDNNHILALVLAMCYKDTMNYGNYFLMNLNQDGSIDSSIGNNGIIGLNNIRIGIFDIIKLKNGKYLVGGAIDNGNLSTTIGLTRLNPNFSIDSSFQNDGLMKFDLGTKKEAIQKMVHTPEDNVILLGNRGTFEMASNFLLKIDKDGNIIKGFGSNGLVLFNNYDNNVIYSIELQNDGKILISGSTETSFTKYLFMYRFNIDGTTDSSWGLNGLKVQRYNNYPTDYGFIHIQNNKVVLIGRTNQYNPNSVVLFRYFLDDETNVPFVIDENINYCYPNPNKRQATINYELSQDENLNIELFNLSGQKVKTFTTNSRRFRGHNSETLDLSDVIIPGAYYISISCSTGAISIKCIKE